MTTLTNQIRLQDPDRVSVTRNFGKHGASGCEESLHGHQDQPGILSDDRPWSIKSVKVRSQLMGKTAMFHFAPSTGQPAVPMTRAPSSNRTRRSLSRDVAAAFQRGLERVATWQARSRGRAELMALSDEMLKDIGVGRSEAYREYCKPFWRP